jgi:Trp operon repressor
MDRAGKHNDRNFNLDNAKHIDQSKLSENRYYTYNGDTEHSFSEIELDFYTKHFSEMIEEKNQKNNEDRHPGRNKTVEMYYHARNTRPEDMILQIGNMKEHATGEELWECAVAYKDKFNELYGDKCVILDMALHMDEKTPHVHIRRVWLAEDENGRECVSQGRALEQLGITAPDPLSPISKNNNAKMSITNTERELFRNICIEKELDIDEERPVNRKRLETAEYIKQEIEREIGELTVKRDGLKEEISATEEAVRSVDESVDVVMKFIEQNQILSEIYAAELAEARKKEGADRYRIIAGILEKEVSSRKTEADFGLERSIARAEANDEVRRLRKFIDEHGLSDEYSSYGSSKNKPKQHKEERKENIKEAGQSFL